MIKISPDLSVISGCIITFAAAIVTFVFTLHAPSTAHVKGASVTIPSKTTDSQTAAPSNSQTVAPATSENAAAALTAPHANSAQNSTNSNPAISTPVQSTPSDTTTPPNNPPASQPTFHIALHEDQKSRSQPMPATNPDMWQLIIPFDITFDPGFTPGAADMPSCTFLTTPVIDHHVLCNVSEKDKGYLGIQYDATSAHGHYKVQVNYTIGGVTHTATTEFDL